VVAVARFEVWSDQLSARLDTRPKVRVLAPDLREFRFRKDDPWWVWKAIT